MQYQPIHVPAEIHTDLHNAAVGEAMGAIEDTVLPALTRLIDIASGATPGIDAAAKADALRHLARDIDLLQSLLAPPRA